MQTAPAPSVFLSLSPPFSLPRIPPRALAPPPARLGENSGILFLVDLAGSERVANTAASGQRLQEARHINRSLSALGDVLMALDQKQSHIPYRNSKLTQLLSSALGGEAETVMLLTVCPHIKVASETLCSLKFGARVRLLGGGGARRLLRIARRTLRPPSAR